MQAEDYTAAIVAILTLVLTLIPGITSLVPPQYATALLALALILKSLLGDLKKPVPVTYTVTGTNPQGQPFRGQITITPPDSVDLQTQHLTGLGFTDLVFTPI